MTEHREILPINPEEVSVGELITGFTAFAPGRGKHERYTFIHVSNVGNLGETTAEVKRSHDLNPNSVYVVSVGIDKMKSRKRHRPIHNQQRLGLWVRRNNSV
ncbi:MAG: hypothetical protein UU23_C0004G0029 [Candidatus Curtissbacteria bacterium GW2011_GWA1_40_9]|uniref:Uncharacterized protein n=1 Tax=Candidatus Curtissbacteria bacterium GW2011_GWA1_40_9 TaxID=1618408 RepID=A0A0G0WRQ3_9BACT|nr:MAG: hypothetical protein UU23_C0004G0029 [Candidatus Curtissbacteria bacterium GW2011_GWA1_40_9]